MAKARREPAAAPAHVVQELSRLAEERGWKAPEVGKRMGKTGQWWRDVRRGRQNLTVADAQKLAEMFGAAVGVRPPGTKAHPFRSLDELQQVIALSTSPEAEQRLGVTGIAALSPEQRRGVILALARYVVEIFEEEDRQRTRRERRRRQAG